MKTKIEFYLIGLQRLFLIIEIKSKPEGFMCPGLRVNSVVCTSLIQYYSAEWDTYITLNNN
jgi:hypothetical protein